MHHVVLERWSRRASPLHRRDARAKILALLAVLIAVATSPAGSWWRFAGLGAIVLAGVMVSRLPARGLAARAAAVLPFSAVFALLLWFQGSGGQAITILLKTYLSALAALLVVSVTPLPDFLRALEWFHAPGLIVLVAQFVYRYLFVISEQAQHMRAAALARGGRHGFRGAASAVSVLFAKSFARAEGVHQAMLARGFTGAFPAMETPHWHAGDVAFILLAAAATVLVRVVG